MRPPLAVILLILAVPLMGSDCSVAARVGGPTSPPPDDVVDPPPVTGGGGGGGVIIVTSGQAGSSTPTAEAAGVERSRVEAMLAVSVWTPPDFLRGAAPSRDLDPIFRTPDELELGSMPAGVTPNRSAPAAVPEPTGLVLLGAGLWVASRFGRARDRRRV